LSQGNTGSGRVQIIYVAILTYLRPIEEIEAKLDAHIDWLKQGYAEGAFMASGRRLPRTGGIILCRGRSLEDVEDRLSRDPLHRHRLSSFTVLPFAPSMADEIMKPLL
jgi:uncharacterized protein YciI